MIEWPFIINLSLIFALIFCIVVIIASIWNFLRGFYHKNYSYFEVLFVGIYFAEQLALILLLEIYSMQSKLWVALFALIVMTTASIQKLTMDSRINRISKLNAVKTTELDYALDQYNFLEDKYVKLSEKYFNILEENQKLEHNKNLKKK